MCADLLLRELQNYNSLLNNHRQENVGSHQKKLLQYSCQDNPMNSMKRQKDRTLKDELPRSVGAQHATGDQWRNNSRKNERMEPKQKQHPVVDGTGDRSKVQCCKEQYCIGTWNVRSMLLLLCHFSRVRLCATPQTAAHQASRSWDSPGTNTGVGCHFLLQCMKVKSESEVAQIGRASCRERVLLSV